MCLRGDLSVTAQFGIILWDFSLSVVTAKHSAALETQRKIPLKSRLD